MVWVHVRSLPTERLGLFRSCWEAFAVSARVVDPQSACVTAWFSSWPACFWSLFARIWLGRKPGDIVIEPETCSIFRTRQGFLSSQVSPSGEFPSSATEFAEDAG
jgi:hypothetical protein